MQTTVGLKKLQQFSGTLAGDEGVAAVVWYDGSAASAKVQIAAGSMVLTSGAAGSEAATTHSDGASSAGTLTFSETTVDTMAELKRVVESVTGWHMTLVACLSSSNPTNLKIAAATQCKTAAGLNLVWDHGDNDLVILALGPESDTSKNAGHRRSKADWFKKDIGDQKDVVDNDMNNEVVASDAVARLKEVTYSAGTSGTDAAPVITIYSASQTTQTLLWTSATGSDDTPVTKTWDDWNMIVSSLGERLVIVNTPGGGTTDAIGLTVIGGYGDAGFIAA